MKKTTSNTMAKAKFAGAGGSPRGFHAMKTRIEAIKRMVPKPPKKYPTNLRNHVEGGGEGALGPYSLSLRAAPSADRPCWSEVERRVHSSWGVILCQSTVA